jgi:hypothetical protein
MQDEGDMDSVSLEDFHPCLSFVKADLFARYESWRYQKPQQKHKIGIKVLAPNAPLLRCWCLTVVWSYGLLQIMNIFIDILSEDTVKNLTGQAPPMTKTDMDLSLASPMAKYQPMTPLGTFNLFLSRALYLTGLQALRPNLCLAALLCDLRRGALPNTARRLSQLCEQGALFSLRPFVSGTMS